MLPFVLNRINLFIYFKWINLYSSYTLYLYLFRLVYTLLFLLVCAVGLLVVKAVINDF